MLGSWQLVCSTALLFLLNPQYEYCLSCLFQGFIGASCETPCESGYFGGNCTQLCTCENGGSCDSSNGDCACLAGWQGANCSQPCDVNTYGLGCSNTCDCRNPRVPCDSVDGTCVCLRGWEGDRCDFPCQQGKALDQIRHIWLKNPPFVDNKITFKRLNHLYILVPLSKPTYLPLINSGLRFNSQLNVLNTFIVIISIVEQLFGYLTSTLRTSVN